MTSQDILMIALLLSIVAVAFLFPGGPGTPRRTRVTNFQPAENWSA